MQESVETINDMSVLDIGYMLQVCHIYSHARPHCRLVECFFLDLISYIYREYIYMEAILKKNNFMRRVSKDGGQHYWERRQRENIWKY